MTYRTLEESLSITVQLSYDNLETVLSDVRSTMISMLRQELTSVKISLIALPAE